MTKIFAGARQVGKTAWLVKESAKTKIPILVMNQEKAKEIRKFANDLGVEIPEPVFLKDACQYGHKDGVKKYVLVDDLETFLPYLIDGVYVSAATLTPSIRVCSEKDGWENFCHQIATLNDTVDLMESENYKERFRAEYWQTKIRYERLKKRNAKLEANAVTNAFPFGQFVNGTPDSLLRDQQRIMEEYLHTLELRAEIEQIPL